MSPSVSGCQAYWRTRSRPWSASRRVTFAALQPRCPDLPGLRFGLEVPAQSAGCGSRTVWVGRESTRIAGYSLPATCSVAGRWRRLSDMLERGHRVIVAGIPFQVEGSGEVLTGVVGPEPRQPHPSLGVAFDTMTLSDIPFDRWSGNPRDAGPIFLLNEPVIYVGTTHMGLHLILVGVREVESGPTALGLLSWSDEVNGASVLFHWPTLHERPHVSWSSGGDYPAETAMTWFPLPEQTAFVELSVDGTVVETVRPTSRVAVVHSIPANPETRFDGRAYDASNALLLTARP